MQINFIWNGSYPFIKNLCTASWKAIEKPLRRISKCTKFILLIIFTKKDNYGNKRNIKKRTSMSFKTRKNLKNM